MVMGMALFAQSSGDFTVPFSDPSKPGKLYVDIKTGSVTIKGTARKDVSVTYKKDSDDDNDDDRDSKSNREGLKRIGSGSLDIEASEYQNTINISSDNWSEGLELLIEVPATLDVKAKAYNDVIYKLTA